MSGFGDKLRREREMRGVTLEEISGSTKISTRSLRALEEDNFDKLPGGIFNKGFVRAYARFLGLDEEQTVADFDAALKEYRLATGHVEELQVETEPEPESSKSPLLIVTLVVLIAAVATGAYLLLARKGKADYAEDHSKIGNPPVVTTTSAPATSSPPESAVNSAAMQASTAPDAKATPTVSHKESSASSDTSKTDESSAGTTDSAVAASDSSPAIRLEVFAKQQSWLSVSADGKSLGQQLLEAQETRTIRAQKEVRLKVGNIGGVEVSFNGKPVNIDGEPKQVKELTFTPDGLHQ